MTQDVPTRPAPVPIDFVRISRPPSLVHRPDAPPPPNRRRRTVSWLSGRRTTLAYLVPLLLLSIAIYAWNMSGAPQRIDDEGTYTAQAYAVLHLGSLSHYTYWYDHPPLGWLQLAGWIGLTDGFGRYDVAVSAAREALLVAHVAAVALLWMLGRRLGLSRPAVAVAVLVYAVSPLGLQYHRTVYLDNVATPWLLAAFVLALAPRKQLAAFTGSALAFGVAVLSKETFLLLLPFLAWTMWRNSDRETRRYTLSVAATALGVLGLSYVMLALVKGEVFPGRGRVSLLDGLLFQLTERTASGSVFQAGSLARRTLELWLQLDPVIAVVGPLAALGCLFVPRLRVVGAALVFLVLFMLRPGYLPVPYVIAMLPFAALVIAGLGDTVLRSTHRPVRAAAALTAAAAAVVAGVAWTQPLRGLLTPDLDAPLRSATAWIEQNVPKQDRLLVDDAVWVDLVRDGRSRDDVVWYYKADTDPAVSALAPRGYVDYDYILSTDSVRTFPDVSATVTDAFDNSTIVATFGTGSQQVDVRRIVPGAAGAESAATTRSETAARVATGIQVAANVNLDLSDATRSALQEGRVDPRVLVLLPGAAASGALTVPDLPAVAGEDAAGTSRHRVLISAVDGEPAAGSSSGAVALRAYLNAQQAPFAPTQVRTDGTGLLLTWEDGAPLGLLPYAAS